MVFGLSLAVIIILIVLISLCIKQINCRLYFTILALIILFFTVWIGVSRPINHKPFSITIIDYLIKFKNDNSNLPVEDMSK